MEIIHGLLRMRCSTEDGALVVLQHAQPCSDIGTVILEHFLGKRLPCSPQAPRRSSARKDRTDQSAWESNGWLRSTMRLVTSITSSRGGASGTKTLRT